ncbi:hypothetical protein EDB82DRAFT_126810 [Fusarium venenatum]|uniref:uncharacterized protein n=1 Tax=Fusarium venenatum TaxID=56646 RepID=UPI001D903445|nr:hypothetical protein EDB82DRAFT_126810 [Fusarium venenatum]
MRLQQLWPGVQKVRIILQHLHVLLHLIIHLISHLLLHLLFRFLHICSSKYNAKSYIQLCTFNRVSLLWSLDHILSTLTYKLCTFNNSKHLERRIHAPKSNVSQAFLVSQDGADSSPSRGSSGLLGARGSPSLPPVSTRQYDSFLSSKYPVSKGSDDVASIWFPSRIGDNLICRILMSLTPKAPVGWEIVVACRTQCGYGMVECHLLYNEQKATRQTLLQPLLRAKNLEIN